MGYAKVCHSGRHWVVTISFVTIVAWMGRIQTGNLYLMYRQTTSIFIPLNSAKMNNCTVSNKHQGYITILSRERMGNQMFYYASLVGIARMLNLTPVILKEEFQTLQQSCHLSTAQVWNTSWIVGSTSKIKKQTPMKVYRRVQALPDTNVTLDGKYFSYKYWFPELADTIRKEFKFRQGIYENAHRFLIRVKSYYQRFLKTHEDIVFVGMHVRRGDFVGNRASIRGKIPATRSYFHSAMQYYANLYKHVAFIVCSNGMHWCHKNLDDGKFFLAYGAGNKNQPAADMALLAQCNHSIISDGTFGWWAAFLAGGQVIYQKDIAVAFSEYWNTTLGKDYYPPNWIPM